MCTPFPLGNEQPFTGFTCIPTTSELGVQELSTSSTQRGQWVQPSQHEVNSRAVELASVPTEQSVIPAHNPSQSQSSFIPITEGSGKGSRRSIQFPSEIQSDCEHIRATQESNASSVDTSPGRMLQPLATVPGFSGSPSYLARQGIPWFGAAEPVRQGMPWYSVPQSTHHRTQDEGTFVHSSPLTAISAFINTLG